MFSVSVEVITMASATNVNIAMSHCENTKQIHVVNGKGGKIHVTKLHLIGCVGGSFLVAVVVVVLVVVFIQSKQAKATRVTIGTQLKSYLSPTDWTCMIRTKNHMIIPANMAIKIVRTGIGQDCKTDSLAASLKISLKSPLRVTTTTPGTCITGINLLYALSPYEVFVTGKTNSSDWLSLL